MWGLDPVDLILRGSHALMAAAWLILDFVVFWLHFKIKDAAAPLDERLERARIMHGIDTVVAWIFLLMLPSGIALALVTGTPLFTTTWLTWKHLLYGLVIADALYLLPISGTALRNLTLMKAGAGNRDELNHQIRHAMDKAMPYVFAIWVLVFAASVLSLLNLRAPQGQEYIFRTTAHSILQPTFGGQLPTLPRRLQQLDQVAVRVVGVKHLALKTPAVGSDAA